MLNKKAFSYPLESLVWIPDEKEKYKFIINMANQENGTFKRCEEKEDFNFD